MWLNIYILFHENNNNNNFLKKPRFSHSNCLIEMTCCLSCSVIRTDYFYLSFFRLAWNSFTTFFWNLFNSNFFFFHLFRIDCQPWEFTCLCGQPRCITGDLVGNGNLDCADGSDEGKHNFFKVYAELILSCLFSFQFCCFITLFSGIFSLSLLSPSWEMLFYPIWVCLLKWES
jgi:hypothetical protein